MDSRKLDSHPKGRVTSRLVIRKIKEYQTRRDVQNNRGWCSGDQGGLQVPKFFPSLLRWMPCHSHHRQATQKLTGVLHLMQRRCKGPTRPISREDCKVQQLPEVTSDDLCDYSSRGLLLWENKQHTRGSHLVLRVQWTQVKNGQLKYKQATMVNQCPSKPRQ